MGNFCQNIDQKQIGIDTGLQLKQDSLRFKQQNENCSDRHFKQNSQTFNKQNQQKKLLSLQDKVKSCFSLKHKDWQSLIKKQFQKLKYSYKQHYIDQANEDVQNWNNLINEAKRNNYNYIQSQQQKTFVNQIKLQYQDVIFYQSEIERGGWQQKSNANGIKVSCRREIDGTVGCRIEATSDVPFEIFISIMIQMQFYKDYTPFLEVSRQEKQFARNCRIGYTQNYIPLFTKREAYFQGIGYSRLNNPKKQIFLFTRSIHDKPNLQQFLKFPVNINPDYIQLDYKYFVVRYRPIKKDVGVIDIGINVDAKMAIIPTWLMEKVATEFGQKLFKNMIKISKNFKGSKWQKNVQKNPHLFLYFQKQIKDFLDKHNLA